MFLESDVVPVAQSRAPVPLSELDYALTAQLVVAWAGEAGNKADDPGSCRLAWWPSHLMAEYGGAYVFGKLTPHTASWAVLQAVREVARRADASLRAHEYDPDRILSLYSLGFETDERLDERMQDLKRSGRAPEEALPGLAEFTRGEWTRDAFATWAGSVGEVDFAAVPSGRRIKAALPPSLEQTIGTLLGALLPLTATYPMPHFRAPA